MKQPTPEEKLDSVGATLAQAVRLLSTPSPPALDRSEALLIEARDLLESASGDTRFTDPRSRQRLRGRLEELQGRLRNLAVLLDSAMGFHAGWIRVKNSLAGGYTAQGEPSAAALAPGRLLLEG
jgi:hypothetical protein